jgi:NAD(P)-dependent dehydrogenase (short-subunit alcohol dehydrogenase family)
MTIVEKELIIDADNATSLAPDGVLMRSSIRMNRAALLLLLALATVVEAQQQAAQSRSAYASKQVVLVTGSTDGLGREVALRLGASGAHVIVHGRNKERGAEVVAEIEKGGKGSARFYAADLGSLQQVRQLGESILRDYDHIDVLINNAGVWGNTGSRQLSADGHELHFAVNYLSGFLLTRILLPLIADNTPGRIINVASGAQNPVQFDDVMLTRNYSDGRGYGQSKLCQIMFTFDLARELKDKGVIVNALHPATMMATTMVLSRNAPARSTIDQGATAVMNLVTSPSIESGLYFNGMRAAQANAQAYDEQARERLRLLSVELTRPPR